MTMTNNTEIKAKTDLYQMVTDRIIKQLELGTIPWKKPWCKAIGGGAFNYVTGRSYGLLNQLSLGQPGPYATFDQIKERGGRIIKGEKASTIVFFKKIEPEQAEDAEVKEETLNKPKWVLRKYSVFHVPTQTLNMPELPMQEEEHEHDRIFEAEELTKGYIAREGITLKEEPSNEAYYSPVEDKIHVPTLSQYKDVAEYYSTLVHEMIHSTGAENRLNRPGLKKASFGSEEYSKEELIAEIGSAAILNGLGIESEDSFSNSVAYIENWIAKLREDKYLIINAASAAERAVKFILNNEAAVGAS